jgi:hypothetical protein
MFLRHVHPPVSCQWLIVLVQAAVFAAPLCSQACCISHSAHSLVTHASLLPLAHHYCPHASIPPRHCTSLACATPVGPATSEHFLFWAAARLQANHRLQSLAGRTSAARSHAR